MSRSPVRVRLPAPKISFCDSRRIFFMAQLSRTVHSLGRTCSPCAESPVRVRLPAPAGVCPCTKSAFCSFAEGGCFCLTAVPAYAGSCFSDYKNLRFCRINSNERISVQSHMIFREVSDYEQNGLQRSCRNLYCKKRYARICRCVRTSGCRKQVRSEEMI